MHGQQTLSAGGLEEVRELIDAIDHRLGGSNYQMLSRAKHGSRLSPTNSVQLILDKELTQIKRIYRNVRRVREKRAEKKPS